MRKQRNLFVFLALVISSWFLVLSAQAAIPWMINYQGRLTDASGKAITGSYTLTFRMYDASTSGTKVWQEEQTIILSGSDNGVFNVVLGAVSAMNSVDFNSPLWLSLQVADDTEMTPRQRVTATGYALNAAQINGLDSTKFLRTDVDTSSSGKLTLTKADAAFLVKPSTDPAATTKMIELQNTAGSSKFSVDAAGNVKVAGDLTVTGSISGVSSSANTVVTNPSTAQTIQPTTDIVPLTIKGKASATSKVLSIYDAAATPAEAAFFDSSGNFTLAGNLAKVRNIAYTWPSSQGSASTVLINDGNGTLTWTAPTSISGVGTITGVTAGTGLSGGGTSGNVTVSLSTPVSLANGGTGAATAAAARASLSAAASGANSDITSLSGLSTALSTTQGGTGLNSYSSGDLPYASAANTLSKLAGNGTATKKLLTMTSLTPAWGTIATGDISGLGTMATQDANNVAITGGTINGTTLGATTAAAGTFTALTATTLNKVALTAPATSATLTVADGKTFTASNTLSLAGTDGTTMTFPASSDTVVTLAATQTLSNKTESAPTVTGKLTHTPSATSGASPGTTGAWLAQGAQTFTDNTTAGSGTATNAVFNSVAQPTLAATNSSVTTTNAASLYLAGPPAAGTNMTLTNAYSLWSDDGTIRFDKESVGTTSTDGLILANNTAAAAGAQQYSPRLRLTGQGWKTNATAASQTVDWITQVVPVQGAANPTSYLDFSSQVNGGGYTNVMVLTSAGNLGIGDTTPPSLLTVGSGHLFQVNSSGDVAKLKGIAYSWPLSQGGANTVLTNDSAGNLSWATLGSLGSGGDVTDVGSCATGACFTSGSPSSTLTFNNATSGTVTLQTVTGALGAKTISLPATTGTLITNSDTGTVTNAMLAGSIAASKLIGTDIAAVGTITSGTWSGTTIGATKGGTGIDTSAATGIPTISAGIWSTTSTTGSGNVVLATLPTITTPTVSGNITFSGTQPKRTIVLTGSGAIVGPASGNADQRRTDGTNFSYYTLNFDASTIQKSYWQFTVPSAYTGATVDVQIFWIANATTGAAKWSVATDSKTSGQGWDTALSAASTATTTTNGTANNVNVTTITGVTSGWAADEPAVFELKRVANDAADTLSVNAQVLQVKVEWTASAESD